jgi:hypothetical protein
MDAENPHALHESPWHSSKIGAGRTLSQLQIIGPLFFEETITAENIEHF